MRSRCVPADYSGQKKERCTLATEDRGFASMDRVKQKEIASKGGKAAHQKGTAHEFTPDEARAAGRKGGMVTRQRGTGVFARRGSAAASGACGVSSVGPEDGIE